MAKTDRTLCLDIGASKIVLAEFITRRGARPELVRYVHGALGVEPETDADATPYIVSTIRDLMRASGVKPGPVVMSISGQAVFPRYVKLPVVPEDKIASMVQYEAEQNLPFSIEEVVWDYEVLGDPVGDELNVMVLAVKTENVSRLTDCVSAAGLDPELVDVGTIALYNAARHSYPDLAGCTMILDVGARSSNLIFMEDKKIFVRSISVAGNAITTELMKEFELPFKDAEALKKEHASVAPGGAAGAEGDEVGARVSKIVRNIVTRLHAEVNRSINFYRSQQQGTAPTRVLLTGGSSGIPHMDTFFREKLKVEVEYMNPLENITIGPAQDRSRAEADAQILGEVVGTALRRCGECPVEITLLPPDLVERRAFRKRQPLLVVAAAGLILALALWWASAHRSATLYEGLHKRLAAQLKTLDNDTKNLETVTANRVTAETAADEIRELIQLRSEWLRIVDAVHHAIPPGMWLTGMTPVTDANGGWSGVTITGEVFADDVVAMAKDGNELDVLEGVCATLRESGIFNPESIATKSFPSSPDGTYRTFTIEMGLKAPLMAKDEREPPA